jgi:hypothetical protein
MISNKTIDKEDAKKIPIDKNIVNKWQEIVDSLSEIFQVPAALIMRVNKSEIEVFRANEDKNNPFKAGQIYKLAGLYCEKVIKSKKKLMVPNALKDKEWNHNPDLDFNMISYLGYPILWPDKTVFGTICLSDTVENKYNKNIEKIMTQYKDIIESYLDLIYKNYLVQRSLQNYKNHGIQLQKKVYELEENQVLFGNNELKIFDLQVEVDKLRKELGLSPKYGYINSEK